MSKILITNHHNQSNTIEIKKHKSFTSTYSSKKLISTINPISTDLYNDEKKRQITINTSENDKIEIESNTKSYFHNNLLQSEDKINNQKAKTRQFTSHPLLLLGSFLPNSKAPSFSIEKYLFIKAGAKNKLLGKGSYGEVYLIENIISHAKYALKIINKQNCISNQLDLSVIHNEISIQQSLKHPYIISLLSYKETNNDYQIALEYARNGSLFNKIKRTKNGFSEVSAFKFFLQTASAIGFLHKNNLVHRDIKPENLLLDENYNIKLCDFGWCQNFKDILKQTCGTYEYMAPEIIQERSYNEKVDIWALGILLFEILHGHSPFTVGDKHDSSKVNDLFNCILQNQLKFKLGLSPNVKDLIRKLLDPNPTKRPSIEEIFTHAWVLDKELNMRNFKNIDPSIQYISYINNKNIHSSSNSILYKNNKETRVESENESIPNSLHSTISNINLYKIKSKMNLSKRQIYNSSVNLNNRHDDKKCIVNGMNEVNTPVKRNKIQVNIEIKCLKSSFHSELSNSDEERKEDKVKAEDDFCVDAKKSYKLHESENDKGGNSNSKDDIFNHTYGNTYYTSYSQTYSKINKSQVTFSNEGNDKYTKSAKIIFNIVPEENESLFECADDGKIKNTKGNNLINNDNTQKKYKTDNSFRKQLTFRSKCSMKNISYFTGDNDDKNDENEKDKNNEKDINFFSSTLSYRIPSVIYNIKNN